MVNCPWRQSSVWRMMRNRLALSMRIIIRTQSRSNSCIRRITTNVIDIQHTVGFQTFSFMLIQEIPLLIIISLSEKAILKNVLDDAWRAHSSLTFSMCWAMFIEDNYFMSLDDTPCYSYFNLSSECEWVIYIVILSAEKVLCIRPSLHKNRYLVLMMTRQYC